MNIFAGEGMACFVKICYNAHFRININGKRGSAHIFTVPCFNSVCVLMVIAGLVVPNADRQACKYRCACFCQIFVISGDLNCQDVFCLLCGSCKAICHIEAIEGFDMIKLPIVHAVKVKLHLHGLDGFHLICLDVDPIHSTIENVVQGTVLRANTNGSIVVRCLYRDLSLCFGIVTRLITDTHTDRVRTISENSILNCDHTVCI